MVYEAKARLADPVYGCVGLIPSLQTQVLELQSQLNTALAEIITLKTQLSYPRPMLSSMYDSSSIVEPRYNNHQQFDGHNSQPDAFTQSYSSLQSWTQYTSTNFALDSVVKGAFPTFSTE